MGGSPQAKILNFLTIIARWIKFLECVEIKNTLNPTKIGGSKMGGFPKWIPPKFKLFHLLSWTHEIGKIIFDKIFGYQNGEAGHPDATDLTRDFIREF